jgi:predicted Zn-dependent peptidase
MLKQMQPGDVQMRMKHIVGAPVHVTFGNTGDREALAIQHMFNITQTPRARFADHIAKGTQRNLKCIRKTSDEVMRHYCAMLPFRANLTDEQCEVARVATNVVGLGFNGQLMKKLRLDMQACYSAGAYFDGGLLHQPLLCVQSAFNSNKCEAAVGQVESMLRAWSNGSFSPEELRMAQQARLSDARMRTPDALLKWRSQCWVAGKDPEVLDETMRHVCNMTHATFVQHLRQAADMAAFTQAIST